MALDLENVDIEKELAAAETAVETPVVETVVEAPVVETPVVEESDEVPAVEVKENKGDPAVALRLARKEAKELKAQQKLRDQEFSALKDELAKLKAPPVEPPAFEVDPAANLKHELDTLKTKQAAIDQQNNVARMENEIQSRLSTSEAEFTKENADYAEASQHVANVILKNIESFGVTDPAQKNAALRVEIQKLTVNAVRQGKDPAEVIYNMAKNYGFTKKEPSKDTKLETIARGQEQRSLGNGSRSESGALTLDSISRMDEDEFAVLVADDKKWNQIGKQMH